MVMPSTSKPSDVSTTWKPRIGKIKRRPFIDLNGIPARTVVSVVVYAAKDAAKRPQYMITDQFCLIAPCRETRVLNFPIMPLKTADDGKFTDSQNRVWEKQETQTQAWRISLNEVVTGTLSLLSAGGDTWGTVLVILDIPEIGKWRLVNDPIAEQIERIIMIKGRP